MKKEERHNKAEVIIIRYLSANASNEDISWLVDWVKESDENSKFFLQCKQSWNLSGILNDDIPDANEEWEKFANKNILDSETRFRFIKPRRFVVYSSIAAAILLLVSVSIWIYGGRTPASQSFQSIDLVSVENLSDGSTVSLNRNSRLKFNNTDIRKAELNGDAFFEVQKDKEHPFVVFVDELKVQVLGTSFYIDAREKKKDIRVFVSTGQVLVKSGSDSLVLEAGEKAVYDRNDKTLNLDQIKDINFLSWKTMNLQFDDSELWQVIQKLNETYNSQIELKNSDIHSCPITVQFKGQSLSSVLTIIAETLDLHIEEKEGNYILSGNSCD